MLLLDLLQGRGKGLFAICGRCHVVPSLKTVSRPICRAASPQRWSCVVMRETHRFPCVITQTVGAGSDNPSGKFVPVDDCRHGCPLACGQPFQMPLTTLQRVVFRFCSVSVLAPFLGIRTRPISPGQRSESGSSSAFQQARQIVLASTPSAKASCTVRESRPGTACCAAQIRQ